MVAGRERVGLLSRESARTDVVIFGWPRLHRGAHDPEQLLARGAVASQCRHALNDGHRHGGEGAGIGCGRQQVAVDIVRDPGPKPLLVAAADRRQLFLDIRRGVRAADRRTGQETSRRRVLSGEGPGRHPQQVVRGSGAKNVYAALDRSLTRLRTDYVDLFWIHIWDILATVVAVARELDCTPAQVALRWSSQQPTVAGLIIGASRVSQLQENVAALDVVLSADQLSRLGAASAIVPSYPATVASPAITRMLFGGHAVTGWTGT